LAAASLLLDRRAMSRIGTSIVALVLSLNLADASAAGPSKRTGGARPTRGADGRFQKAAPRDRAIRVPLLGRALFNPLVGFVQPATIAVRPASATQAGSLTVAIPDMKIDGLYATTRIQLRAIDVHGRPIVIDATIQVPSAGHGHARGVGPATIVGAIPPGAELSPAAIEQAVGLSKLQPGRRLAPIWAPLDRDDTARPAR
jgi:hypothetical protein